MEERICTGLVLMRVILTLGNQFVGGALCDNLCLTKVMAVKNFPTFNFLCQCW